ncbi:hypothetical protein KAR48_10965 [bacterium]|nr:hypothetical protein [bacterium]
MEKQFLIIVIDKRKKEAVKMQQILTEWGCLVKTRLGIHEGVLDDCTETGTIFLELVGELEKLTELNRKLNLLAGVNAKLVTV